MELVHTDSNFEPEESFFQLFSDPRSTRLTRVQLREDFVHDRDLEAIRKQVGCHKLFMRFFQNKPLTPSEEHLRLENILKSELKRTSVVISVLFLTVLHLVLTIKMKENLKG